MHSTKHKPHQEEHKQLAKHSPFIVSGIFALFFGLFLTVMTAQQSQDNRSEATGLVNGIICGIWSQYPLGLIQCNTYPPPSQPTPTLTSTPAPQQPTATNTPPPAATLVPSQTVTTIPVSQPPVDPNGVSVQVTLKLHGVGKGGDSVNANSQGNMNPNRPQRTVSVDVYNVDNQLAASKLGTVTFNNVNGIFIGTVYLGTDLPTGVYTVKIKTDQYLRGVVSGIQTLTKGQAAALPPLTMIAGDVNNDNAVNIVDYNIFVGCFSDLLPPVNCSTTNAVLSDLNDDGKANQFDYNLFIRELTNIGGQ